MGLGMKNVLNIAVFGLSLNSLEQIKEQILLSLPENLNVRWVNLAEQKIDLLLVNDVFFNSPGIQKLLTIQNIVYLRLVKKVENAGRIVGDQLFYPFSNIEHLHDWLSRKLLSQHELTAPVKSTLEVIMPVQSVMPTVLNPVMTTEQVFSEIFTPRNGYIQLFDAHGFLALVDTRTERVWVAPNKEIQFNETLNQTYATAQLVQDTIKDKDVYDLRIWLWKVVNASPAIQLPQVSLNQNFRLEIWPQFEKDLQRRDFLKMATCFSQGAQIDQVKQSLNLSNERVLNFVACAVLLQLGQFIDQNEVKYQVDTQQVETGQMNKLRGFIGKLRKKLGL